MDKHPQWPTAQKEEKKLWDGVVRDEHYIFRVLEGNSQKITDVRRCLPRTPETSMEVGIGPLGLGISAFLPEIPNRFAVDPLPPVPLESPMESSKELRTYLRDLRAPIRYVRGCGEQIPIRSESMDLVICCNVLDHTSDPDAVLKEIHRILKPEGLFFFDVDAFSMLGLLKWHCWTKYAHRNEILVTTHPYRMHEGDAVRRLRSAGFQLRKVGGHTVVSKLIGHFRVSTFLGWKCSP